MDPVDGGETSEPTIGPVLDRTRRDSFVGRGAELSGLLAATTSPATVLAVVHGPGGVGKSALLSALCDAVIASGHRVVRADGADIDISAEGFATAVGDLTDHPTVVIDRFEQLDSIADWIWQTWIPGLPLGTHVVVAGRVPPPESWRSDPAFIRHAHVLALRNLPHEQATELARRRGIHDDTEVAALVRGTFGHPLAIVIASDVHRSTNDGHTTLGVLFGHPDVSARLLEHFLDESVTPEQRAALWVCGHARRVDRSLLRAALDLDDTTADELLTWLLARPYAETHPDGLSVHDVVRDALDRDLRVRDREAFLTIHSRIRTLTLERMSRADGREYDRLAGDLFHLHRGNPAAQVFYSFDDLGALVSRPLRDDPAEHAWLCSAYGPEHRSETAAHWIAAQPQAWTVFEDAVGERAGAALFVRLDQASADQIDADPVARWAIDEIARRRPVEPGEPTMFDAMVNFNTPEEPGAIADQVAAESLRRWHIQGLGWVIMSTALEPVWEPLWSYVGFERLGTCPVGDALIAVWARDFARSPYVEWLSAMEGQELDDLGTAPPPSAPHVALSHADFSVALHRALKDFQRTDRLRANPLSHSRLVPAAGGPDELRRVLRDTVDLVAATPRMESPARALDRTFIRPAGSQERAAEVLGLPFSTYRRHLLHGIERVTEILWDRELHDNSPR